ncbi:hypothetical protein L596_017023 [Steinernema carpocapsae]|uniref:Uncharacterized protein n=1 Tax=Steinernema carpocapsae TaxID=34508 RepID=A0A4U5N0H4_STECR|nr:hypothetical protein L596_017023 [Steinernema carpocapsae]
MKLFYVKKGLSTLSSAKSTLLKVSVSKFSTQSLLDYNQFFTISATHKLSNGAQQSIQSWPLETALKFENLELWIRLDDENLEDLELSFYIEKTPRGPVFDYFDTKPFEFWNLVRNEGNKKSVHGYFEIEYEAKSDMEEPEMQLCNAPASGIYGVKIIWIGVLLVLVAVLVYGACRKGAKPGSVTQDTQDAPIIPPPPYSACQQV